jgi:hypothetical protein
MKPAVEVTAAVTGHHLILSATDEGKLTPERYQKFLSMRYYDGLEKGTYLSYRL